MMIVLILFLAWAAAVSFVLLMNKLHEKPVVATPKDLEAIVRLVDAAKKSISKERITLYDVDTCKQKLDDLVETIQNTIKERRDAE